MRGGRGGPGGGRQGWHRENLLENGEEAMLFAPCEGSFAAALN